jgi:hypothetical protein
MKSLVAVAALLVLAGCGSADEQGSGGGDRKDATTPGVAMVGGCAADAPEVEQAETLGAVDLDGDGTPDQVRLTATGGKCGDLLFAELGTGYVATPLSADEPPVGSAFAIAPTWSEGQLLVTRADHPRGGYQLRVYTVDGETLTELTVDGNPPVPFVATDVTQGQARVDCSDEGIVVATGGQVTSYAVDGTRVSASTPNEKADVPAGQPAFASCRA